MTAYLIVYGADTSDRFAAYAFPKRADAWKASTSSRVVPGVPAGSHAGGHAYVIETAQDVTFSGRLLVEVYKELTGANYNSKLNREERVLLLMDGLRAHAIREKNMETNITIEEPTKADTVPLTEAPKRGRKPKAEGAPKRTYARKDAATEAAKRGVMPDKPIVTSETNKHRQKHFDALEKAANEGDWDTVRGYQMKGTDTYCKMIHRYRDNLLAYHAASTSQQGVASMPQSEERELEAA